MAKYGHTLLKYPGLQYRHYFLSRIFREVAGLWSILRNVEGKFAMTSAQQLRSSSKAHLSTREKKANVFAQESKGLWKS